MTAVVFAFLALFGARSAWPGRQPDLSQAFSALSSSIKRERQGFVGPGGKVRLNAYICRGSGIGDETVTQDIARARRTLAQCGLKVSAPSAPYPRFSLPNGRCDLKADEGQPRFSNDERALISRYRGGGTKALSVFYLSWDSGDPNEAGTSIPADYAAQVKTKESETFRAQAVGALFVFQAARQAMGADKYRYTLPHEMVHILTANSRHLHGPRDAGNLMYRPPGCADPSWTQQNALDRAQCAKIRQGAQ